jgi:ankyrin repeat protein
VCGDKLQRIYAGSSRRFCKNGDISITGVLSRAGAASSGQLEAARVLLDDRVDVHARSAKGRTPLQAAEAQRATEVAEFLRGRGG